MASLKKLIIEGTEGNPIEHGTIAKIGWRLKSRKTKGIVIESDTDGERFVINDSSSWQY